jgi:hypothetical protein
MWSTTAAKIEFSTPLPKDLYARWSESFLFILGSVVILHDDLREQYMVLEETATSSLLLLIENGQTPVPRRLGLALHKGPGFFIPHH